MKKDDNMIAVCLSELGNCDELITKIINTLHPSQRLLCLENPIPCFKYFLLTTVLANWNWIVFAKRCISLNSCMDKLERWREDGLQRVQEIIPTLEKLKVQDIWLGEGTRQILEMFWYVSRSRNRSIWKGVERQLLTVQHRRYIKNNSILGKEEVLI